MINNVLRENANEAFERILKPTYQCIVYQEQVMDIVKDCAGFSMARADFVRKAMSKKHQDEIDAERSNFVYGNAELGIDGAIARGMSEEKAHHIWDLMEAFGRYAFNKSHAACYAILAYKMGYLKAYYPSFYLANCINWEKEAKNVPLIIMDAIENGVQVMCPDVNLSEVKTSADSDKIYYGLNSIKSFPEEIAKTIVKERKENGIYKSINDFILRTYITKANYEKLLNAGGFDSIEPNRTRLSLANPTISELLEKINTLKKNLKENKDITAIKEEILNTVIDYIPEDKLLSLQNEYDALGVYLSGHPIDEYSVKTPLIAEIINNEDEEECCREISISGCITNLTKKTTKKGKPFYQFKLSDRTGTITCFVWSSNIPYVEENLKESAAVCVKGSLDISDFNDEKSYKITVDNCFPLTERRAMHYRVPVTHFELEWINRYATWCKDHVKETGVNLTFLDSITGLEYLADGFFSEIDIQNDLKAKKILD